MPMRVTKNTKIEKLIFFLYKCILFNTLFSGEWDIKIQH